MKRLEDYNPGQQLLLARAEALDTEEGALCGPGNRGDELPEEVRFRHERLARIHEAKAVLEVQTQQEQPEDDAEGDDTPESTGPDQRPEPFCSLVMSPFLTLGVSC